MVLVLTECNQHWWTRLHGAEEPHCPAAQQYRAGNAAAALRRALLPAMLAAALGSKESALPSNLPRACIGCLCSFCTQKFHALVANLQSDVTGAGLWTRFLRPLSQSLLECGVTDEVSACACDWMFFCLSGELQLSRSVHAGAVDAMALLSSVDPQSLDKWLAGAPLRGRQSSTRGGPAYVGPSNPWPLQLLRRCAGVPDSLSVPGAQ